MSEPKKPDNSKGKAKKKPPMGTKKFPWYMVPEHTDPKSGKKVPAAFFRLDPAGVWKTEMPPAGSVVKTDTSY